MIKTGESEPGESISQRCRNFWARSNAQAALEARPELTDALDGAGNGVACEDLPAGEPTVVVCNEALGTLVEVSQDALDQDSLDFPYHLATDAEIASGECAARPPVTPFATPVTPDKDADAD